MSLLLLFRHWVLSDSLWPHGLQHDRLLCPPLSSRVCWNSCPLSQRCYLTISLSVISFSWLQSFPASVFSNESALCIWWLKYWSFSFSNSPSNEYSGLISFRFPLGLTGLILQSKGTLKRLFLHHSSKASILQHSAFFIVQLSYPYMTTGKTIALTIWT